MNSYRNLVSCCTGCNSEKNTQPASEFLRKLYRDGRLSAAELADRRAALQALAQGRLKPDVVDDGTGEPVVMASKRGPGRDRKGRFARREAGPGGRPLMAA